MSRKERQTKCLCPRFLERANWMSHEQLQPWRECAQHNCISENNDSSQFSASRFSLRNHETILHLQNFKPKETLLKGSDVHESMCLGDPMRAFAQANPRKCFQWHQKHLMTGFKILKSTTSCPAISCLNANSIPKLSESNKRRQLSPICMWHLADHESTNVTHVFHLNPETFSSTRMSRTLPGTLGTKTSASCLNAKNIHIKCDSKSSCHEHTKRQLLLQLPHADDTQARSVPIPLNLGCMLEASPKWSPHQNNFNSMNNPPSPKMGMGTHCTKWQSMTSKSRTNWCDWESQCIALKKCSQTIVLEDLQPWWHAKKIKTSAGEIIGQNFKLRQCNCQSLCNTISPNVAPWDTQSSPCQTLKDWVSRNLVFAIGCLKEGQINKFRENRNTTARLWPSSPFAALVTQPFCCWNQISGSFHHKWRMHFFICRERSIACLRERQNNWNCLMISENVWKRKICRHLAVWRPLTPLNFAASAIIIFIAFAVKTSQNHCMHNFVCRNFDLFVVRHMIHHRVLAAACLLHPNDPFLNLSAAVLIVPFNFVNIFLGFMTCLQPLCCASSSGTWFKFFSLQIFVSSSDLLLFLRQSVVAGIPEMIVWMLTFMQLFLTQSFVQNRKKSNATFSSIDVITFQSFRCILISAFACMGINPHSTQMTSLSCNRFFIEKPTFCFAKQFFFTPCNVSQQWASGTHDCLLRLTHLRNENKQWFNDWHKGFCECTSLQPFILANHSEETWKSHGFKIGLLHPFFHVGLHTPLFMPPVVRFPSVYPTWTVAIVRLMVCLRQYRFSVYSPAVIGAAPAKCPRFRNWPGHGHVYRHDEKRRVT